MSPTLEARTVSGIRWTVFNAIGEKLLSFGTTMVIARILDPEHFGLYALAFVVLDSFSVFKNLGLDAAIIQRKDRVEDAATTALIVLPITGMALYAALWTAAPWVAAWLAHPEVTMPIRALGTMLIFAGVSSVPLALVRKGLQLDIQAKSNLAGMMVYALVAITLAWHGWALWSLVIAYLSRWIVATILQWILLGWAPRGRFDAALLREMMHYSKYVVGAWTIAFITSSLDKIAIGRWLGAKELGYYTLCLGLANFATAQLSARIFHVAFPAFSAMQADPKALRQGFLRLTKYLVFIALPIAGLLILVPRDVLLLFYGKRWVKAAPILQALAVGGALQAIRAGVEPILLGCGRSKAVFSMNLLQLGLLLGGAVTMAVAGSTLGVAWAVVAAIALPTIIGLGLAMRQVGIGWGSLFRELLPLLLSAALMAVVVLFGQFWRSELRVGVGEMVSVRGAWIAAAALAGGLVYLATVWWLDRRLVDDLWRMVHPQAATAAARRTTILFVESGTGYGGSATCLANLIECMDLQRFRPIVAYYGEGIGIGRIRQLGADMVLLPPRGRLWFLLRLIRRERVDLIHNNNDINSQISTILAATLTARPCTCSLRGTRALTKKERLFVPLIRQFIAVSEATRSIYLRSGIPAGHIQTLCDGIDLQKFSVIPDGPPPPELGLVPGRLTVGFVSRLIPGKGVQEFLEAARQVVQQLPDVQFVLVGGDPTPDESHLKAWRTLVAQLGLDGHVTFAGWRDDIHAVTRHFDVAAQASKFNEGWGMSLLEAMACGKPVVATRVGGVPEVVEDGRTAFLVEPGDARGLAAALIRVLRDGELRRRMGEAGRARAQQFDQRLHVSRMERLYLDVLSGRVA